MNSNQEITVSQQRAAKVAGFLFLAIIVIAIFGEFVLLSDIFVDGDMATTVQNIQANELQFRMTIATELITFAAVTVLALVLYVVLKPVHKTVAQLGLFWRLGEASIYAIVLLLRYLSLTVLSEAEYLSAFDQAEINALVGFFLDAYGVGYGFGIIFFSLGSTVFSYLFYKSGYIPKVLAAWGIFASVMVFISNVGEIIFSEGTNVALPAGLAILLFEVCIGIWLLIKGINTGKQQDVALAPASI